MKRGLTLVLTAVVTLGSSGSVARPASATPATIRNPDSREATWHRETRPEGAVISLSVVPTTGRAEVVIGVDGAVQVQDFILRNPNKIVVDITGAALGLPAGDYYDRVTRGGILNVRYSQFRRNVVRVVLTLDAARPYSVVRGEHEVRISVQGENEKFVAWHVGDSAPERTVAKATVRVETPTVAAVTAPAIKAPATSTPAAVTPAPANAQQHANAEARMADVRFVAQAVPSRDPNTGRRMSTEQPMLLRSAQQRQTQPRITIAWENADIHDVLAAFAAFSGRTIIPAKDVVGKVTAEIANQPWDVAMRAILNANGFDAVEDLNGIIIVDTFEHLASRQAAQPLATRTLRLNYARAATVAPMIFQRLSRVCARQAPQAATPVPGADPAQQQPPIVLDPNCPPRGAVSADSLTNSISVTDVPFNLDELEAYTRSLDLRQPQVNIKAKIILVDRTSLEALGLRYDIGTRTQFFNDIIPRLDSTGATSRGAGQVAIGGNTIAAIANATQRVPSTALQLVYSTALGGFDFTTFLEALQTTTLLDVQAEPSASVLNNRTANLTAGTQVPIRVIDASAGGAGQSNFPRATVRMEPTGIILNVTPQVTNNRQVQMRVHVENSDVSFQGGDIGAVFPRQSVDNEVLVADGETAVMGGLTQTTVRITKSGIPLLVDLPFIGRLFGVTQRQESKRDLLILITPHIIDDGQQPSDPRN